ncbi:hypothetical protein QAC84_12805 [Staphylococcus aureus]|nr:hypothetical protein [Staphylococcus aureus]
MYFKNSSLNYIPTTFGGEPNSYTYNLFILLLHKKKHFPKMESASSEP